MTLHQYLTDARARLRAAGVPDQEAAIDVELFARTILGWDRVRMIVESAAAVPPALEPGFSEWVERCARHEPVAYIIGVREFWGLDFRVTPAVLIPRPETEMVVEEVLKISGGLTASAHRSIYRSDRSDSPRDHRNFLGNDADSPNPSAAARQIVSNPPTIRIADIGTGSGNIAVSVAHDLPTARLVASDVSSDALAVAYENAVRHGVADRIEFFTTSYLGGVDGDFDIIAANPPYVREVDKPGLGANVRHEPEVALFGGMNGMLHIEGVLDTAVHKLRPHGWLIMEIGFGQDDRVADLVKARPALRLHGVRSDLQGIPRTFVIQLEEHRR